jgi:hypothetical protein
MLRSLVLSVLLAALALGPALALRAEVDRDAALVPYFKQGFRESQALAREDTELGSVHAVLLEEGDGVARHRAVLFVFATRGDQRTLLHQAEYPWATLERLADIDADGKLDLVVHAGTGGNCWTCGWVEAFTLTPAGARTLIAPERFQSLEDVDGDGKLEAIESEAKWEFYEGLCHACSPRVERIHRLTSSGWNECSEAFPDYYRTSVATLEKQLEQQASHNSADWDDYQMGTLISILLNRVRLGEKDEAWKAFQARVQAWRARLTKDEDEGRARIDAILDALRRDLKL